MLQRLTGSKLHLLYFLLLFFLLIAFTVKSTISLDPDFGWHLMTGQIILHKGIPFTDPFSFSMPSYHFVDHEWLTDVFSALLYPLIGYVGLATGLAVAAVVSLVLAVNKKFLVFSLLPLLLTGVSLFSFIGVRPQVLSWLFFSLLILIRKKVTLSKQYLLLPLLFFLWANLHGGFSLGIGALCIILFMQVVQKRMVLRSALPLLGLCIGGTLCTPYGFSLWREIGVSVFDPSLRWEIMEWAPAFLNTNMPFWLYVALSVPLVVLYYRRFTAVTMVLYTVFLFFALSSMRNIPYWLIVSLPITAEAFHYFFQEATQKNGTQRLRTATLVVIIICLCACIFQTFFAYEQAQAITEATYYPKQAALYIQHHNPESRIFTTYGWGGYFIWKTPKSKVFMDGRMPSWQQHPNLSTESRYAYKEYQAVMNLQEPLHTVIKKYHVSLIVLPPAPKMLTQIKTFVPAIDALLSAENIGEKNRRLQEAIQKMGGQKVYEDTIAVVYKIMQ